MRRIVFRSMMLVVLSVPLLAQDTPQPATSGPPEAEGPAPTPTLLKLRRICEQLDLTKEQRQHADGLLEVFAMEERMGGEELIQRLEDIRVVMQDRDEAVAAGDTERAKILQKHLQELTPRAYAERNFVDGLMPALNEQQKARFQMLLERAKTLPDLSLKPIEVVRIARQQKLTAEQEEDLESLMAGFRKAVANASKPQAKVRLAEFARDVRAILNPQQRQGFDEEIRTIDPELFRSTVTSEARTPVTTTQPSEQP